MKTIDLARLKTLLAGINHATPVGFTALTTADTKVTPFGAVYKLSRVNALTGCQYETSVNRRLTKEGSAPTFVAKVRANQTERISPCLARKMVGGEERFYLPVQINHAREPLYLVRRPHRLGRSMLTAVPKATVAPYLPVPRTYENQGVVKPILYRDYLLSSLTSLSIGGEQYRIRQ